MLCRHTKRLIPVDFGSSWNVERSRVRSVGEGACRSYAAPEMFDSDSVPGFRADQFSTMVVFYELLTGQIAYDGLGGRACQAKAHQHLEIPLSPASVYTPAQAIATRYARSTAQFVDRPRVGSQG